MKKYLLTACLFALCSLVAVAQDREGDESSNGGGGGFDKSKLFFGGNLGLAFGSYSTLVNVSPQIGYRFNRYLAAGAGINFLYSSNKYDYAGYKEEYGVTGLNVFGRFYPIEYIFLQVQPEANYTWLKYHFYNGEPDEKLPNKIVPSLLGGIGAAIPAGRGYFIVTANYDLLQNERSPYGNRAFFNFGYNFGF
ncbi:hypothetical protein A4H97_06920 [Niastella yeongjuensis]|uniref:Outer membrane protein beta-barrel domain-containing protein n=1 Tax=Niastella yeongjuensis TaxID=354355 RepID=A0A1V9EMF8_9BACT|nr:hypothetical protein [Niastella yeongjuensis]OQP47232.1 hypothetical protein A4H97_06920 [Niastella yeongjuensis]SEN75051.1 hypothetical protein SAMN05660816_01411 [Niastella yeongjuensis]